MATLQKIRNRAGLLIIVVGVALLAFIIGDGLRSGSSLLQDNKMVALKIDGKKVKYDEYQQLLTQRTEPYERQRQGKLTDQDRVQISNQLAQELIADYVLEQEAKAIGLRVTPAEVSALIFGEGLPTSQWATQFFSQFGVDMGDPEQIRSIMSELDMDKIKSLPAEQQSMMISVRNQWLETEKQIRTQRLSEKVNALLTRSYAINSLDEKYTVGLGTRTVAVVRTPSTILPNDQVTVTDQQVQAYYDSHKQLYAFPFEQAKVNYYSTLVRPSEADYAAAKAEVDTARLQLLATTTPAKVVRNYDNGNAYEIYFTDKELEQYLSTIPNAMTMLREGAIGSVNEPVVVNDSYTLIKLIDRKQAPEEVKVNLIPLDTTNALKADSLIAAIQSGSATLAQIVATYSMDEQVKANGGYLINQDSYTGMPDSTFTEAELFGMGLDTLTKTPINQFVKMERPGATLLVRRTAPTASVNHYKIAQLTVPINFSEETFRKEQAKINEIFTSDKSFDKMMEDAQAAGLSVVRGEYVNSSSAALASIPNSREIISWALRSKAGAVSDKLFRCGENDYLVVAQVEKKYPAGFQPFEQVADRVRDIVLMEQRGDQLASNLAGKQLKSLNSYATEMQSSVDTLYNISYVTAPSTPSALVGKAMTMAIGQLSAPFRAGTEVVVLQPISENVDASVTKPSPAATAQKRRSYGQQMAYRAMQELIMKTPVEDTRYRFW
ncbi:peptidylprolyl isomerase [Porphyromonas asaccharolytica]|uniref:peptidylprolyl isomerase n=1 Tax=Porphyromonas asaccharolytica TaxID=28123 RepID=UPI00248D444A|nr:peptidylprolyl isomerase [Porphyromonas asaccharolytica]